MEAEVCMDAPVQDHILGGIVNKLDLARDITNEACEKTVWQRLVASWYLMMCNP
jgi:hypothetical protein